MWAQRRLPDSRSIGALALPASFLGVGLVTLAATLYLMGGMISGPGAELGQLGWFIGAWVLMMAAMMLPSVAPMALTFARVTGERSKKGQAAFVLAAYAIDYFIRTLDLAQLAWDRKGPMVTGAAIAAAGVYQLTPFKRA